MSAVEFLGNAAKAAATGVALVAAVPVFGAIGTVTATGAAVGSAIGVAAAAIDAASEDDS